MDEEGLRAIFQYLQVDHASVLQWLAGFHADGALEVRLARKELLLVGLTADHELTKVRRSLLLEGGVGGGVVRLLGGDAEGVEGGHFDGGFFLRDRRRRFSGDRVGHVEDAGDDVGLHVWVGGRGVDRFQIVKDGVAHRALGCESVVRVGAEKKYDAIKSCVFHTRGTPLCSQAS